MLSAMLVLWGTATMPMSNSSNIDLDALAAQAHRATVKALPDEKIGAEDLTLTIHELDLNQRRWRSGDWKGEVSMFPASVVKLFWLAYMGEHLRKGTVRLSAENDRAAKDMIVDSSNDATGAVVNLTTGALPGPELEGKDYEAWVRQRQSANAWFKGLGYDGINVLNRTYNEGPYGRESQIIRDHGRNALNTDATARLMSEIMLEKVVDASRCRWMLGHLARTVPADDPKAADSQVFGFIGEVMPRGTKLWSKAGWMSQVRHDVAAVTFPDGRTYVIAIFTKRPNNKAVLQTAAAEIVKGLGYEPVPPRAQAD